MARHVVDMLASLTIPDIGHEINLDFIVENQGSVSGVMKKLEDLLVKTVKSDGGLIRLPILWFE